MASSDPKAPGAPSGGLTPEDAERLAAAFRPSWELDDAPFTGAGTLSATDVAALQGGGIVAEVRELLPKTNVFEAPAPVVAPAEPSPLLADQTIVSPPPVMPLPPVEEPIPTETGPVKPATAPPAAGVLAKISNERAPRPMPARPASPTPSTLGLTDTDDMASPFGAAASRKRLILAGVGVAGALVLVLGVWAMASSSGGNDKASSSPATSASVAVEPKPELTPTTVSTDATATGTAQAAAPTQTAAAPPPAPVPTYTPQPPRATPPAPRPTVAAAPGPAPKPHNATKSNIVRDVPF